MSNYLDGYRRNTLYAMIVVVFLFFSCEKFVEVSPTDRVTTEIAFSDSINATASVIGIYTDMISDPTFGKLLNGGVTVSTALAGDELVANSAPTASTQFYKNSISPTSNNWNSAFLWRSGFQVIYKANACIEALLSTSKISESLKRQLLGEVKFIRCLIYFNLFNLYGDIPYLKTTDYNVNARSPRTIQKDILNDIQIELEEARSMLSYSYPSNGRQRPNRAAVQSLLARIYLYQGKWKSVEDESTQVIENGVYSLVNDLSQVFSQGSSEIILQMDPIVSGVETGEGFYILPANSVSVPRYTLSQRLKSAFANNDLRFLNWVGKNSVVSNGVTKEYYFPRKYKLGRDNWVDKPVESYSFFRLAELYLLRAEARANLGKTEGPGSAIDDVNIIRRRAGLQDTTASNVIELNEIIMHEKRLEFFCEWGTRWFDLKRRGEIDKVMTLTAPDKGTTWSSDWKFFPIPNEEILSNPNLTQNNGYPR